MMKMKRTTRGRSQKAKDLKMCQNFPDGRFQCYRSADVVITIEHPNPKESEIFMCNQCCNFEMVNNSLFRDRLKNRVTIADYYKKK